MLENQSNDKSELTQKAFDNLLAAFGEDEEIAAQKYLEIRENLHQFFTWRGFAEPAENADETLNRTARKITEGEEILDIRAYIFGVARYLALEINRREEKARQALVNMPPGQAASEEKAETEAKLECLESCLNKLSENERVCVVNYYQGNRHDKISNRKQLLEKSGLSASAFRMKILRLRERLENCLLNCLKEK